MPAATNGSDLAPGEATLQVLNFQSLLTGDKTEQAKLLSACEDLGFFYLDLRSWEAGSMLQKIDDLWQVMVPWFEQPLDEKSKTETISDAHGFKPPGVQSGVNENSRDGFEALRTKLTRKGNQVSRVCLLNRSHLPEVVHANLRLFEGFQLSAHYVLMALLRSLSDGAGLEGRDRYESYHPEDLPSKSTLFFLHHPVSQSLPDRTARGHNAHTDVGSFTLLFTEQPGLQVLSPKTNEWEYVAARPGHAIINVADTLRFLSGRRFRSAMHRVLPPGGSMSKDRYSMAYFLRAADTAVFKGMNGEEVTAEQWFLSKYSSYNETTQQQRLNSVATGGMDRDLGVAI
ncbi:hypothetical protein QQS21_004264 [Conoideocrella luteorostrata]|uniref:Fe2OG dioxygenase domain-containing protein n=1 Tax=Conoideocrella luteorostrata TaxID=1105319 RepID=A0AAJ0CRR2_9HYPO|nr:hypothetical protein QQS21_004264 [Conoideocrella luteorostrata]